MSPLARRPRISVALEFARALGALLLLPARAFEYVVEREALQDELRAALDDAPRFDRAAPAGEWPTRPLVVFVSCAEASGEHHAEALVRAIRDRARAAGAPAPRFVGLGGDRLAAAGVERLGDPVSRAAMGFQGVLGALPFYLRLLTTTARAFRDLSPDVFVPVDSPALHVPMAHLARRARVPVAHYITPQYWGWAPWRVRGYRRAVDLALTILPFEPAWFARRGVDVRHVGHPIQDHLEGVPTGGATADGPLALLPGSRAGVVKRNLPWMLDVVARATDASREVVVLQGDDEHRAWIEDRVREAGLSDRCRVRVGDLHGELARARAAFSVSGTVLLDLLHHRLPTVVVYRLESRRVAWMGRHFLTAPWFSSINLLAGRELVPEFSFHGDGPRAEVEAALARCVDDDRWRARTRVGLESAARRLGPAGAARRGAAACLALALGRLRAATPAANPAVEAAR